ncbi:MAG: hypothetical protein ABI142_04995, partial [Bryocella sp.]
ISWGQRSMDAKLKGGLIFAAVFLALAGGEVAWIHHKNNEVATAPKKATVTYAPDNLVYLRKLHPSTLKDEKELIGATVWMSAAAQLDYYPYVNHRADYAHPVSTLPGAVPLHIIAIFEQVPPSSGRTVSRIPKGMRHVLAAFTMPASTDPKAEYATPIGNYDTTGYNFYSDGIFFFDDPHQLYDYWGPVVWAHIDKHEAALGMSEDQMMLALGQVMVLHGDKIGDRSVTYNNNEHPINVVFENDKATSITPQAAP